MSISVDDVRNVAEPVVESRGLYLEEVTVTHVGNRDQVVVVVDADNGVDLDSLALLSGEISRVLDESDTSSTGPYVLEVTSPGVSRPLTLPRHWRQASKRLVSVSLTSGEAIRGRIERVNDESVQIRVDGQVRELPFVDVQVAKVEIEFDRKET